MNPPLLKIDRHILQRFFSKIQLSTISFYNNDPCWEWTAAKIPAGYGVLGTPKKYRLTTLAHRLAYMWFVEPIPPTLECDHLCRNRGCVNPAHLEATTHRINILRGTGMPARHAVKTHCQQGHEFSAENTAYTREGYRRCKQCRHNAWKTLCQLPTTHPRVITYQQAKKREQIKKRAANHQQGKFGNRFKTHCPQGHPYSGDNVHYTPSGRRKCRECGKLYMRQKRSARVK